MRILYVATLASTINTFLIPHIDYLQKQGHCVDIACNVDAKVVNKLIENGCNVYNVEFQRSPLKKQNYIAYRKLKNIILKGEYDLVHTHTPIASTCVRLACRKIKNVKIFYTAHGFHFFRGAPIQNWLLYYPIEKWLSAYTETLITINKEDYERAKKFKATNVEYIPSIGLDVNKYRDVVVDKTEKLHEIGVSEDSFVVLSVGEINKRKNHRVIIKAIAKIKNPKIHYVICGQGPMQDYLLKLAYKLKISNQIHLLGFRNDIAEICKCCNVFAFPSLREGLGMAALEAMASGVPIVTSNVQGIVDYSIDGKTGFTCRPNDVEAFSKSISKLFTDKTLSNNIGLNNVEAVNKYKIENVLVSLQKLYEREDQQVFDNGRVLQGRIEGNR